MLYLLCSKCSSYRKLPLHLHVSNLLGLEFSVNRYGPLLLHVVAEYRTVSGVAGPLVILDKVKVGIVLSILVRILTLFDFHICLMMDTVLALIISGTQVSGNCQHSFRRWNDTTWSSPRSWWGEGCCSGDYHFSITLYLSVIPEAWNLFMFYVCFLKSQRCHCQLLSTSWFFLSVCHPLGLIELKSLKRPPVWSFAYASHDETVFGSLIFHVTSSFFWFLLSGMLWCHMFFWFMCHGIYFPFWWDSLVYWFCLSQLGKALPCLTGTWHGWCF